MKRRLSVAISLIGDTQVVFLDEPTTGLDPESRNHLWKLKSRYGKSYQLTMSADPAFEKDVERMVNNISPDVVKTYEVSGTQKFQIPKRDTIKVRNLGKRKDFLYATKRRQNQNNSIDLEYIENISQTPIHVNFKKKMKGILSNFIKEK
ncbi:ABC transporter A family member 3 [Acorus calamus]|uniref:ABC transporter A family member 3 n=1 Tax=Acorus calamus TaxID=4465 RepID=A0AAV9EIY4_ACOCL|nr:ABC transporter A family member 3 [Acorus calamus]